MDWITLEGILYKFWDQSLLDQERKAIRRAWFDYRHIHPALRSFVFLRDYERAYADRYVKHYGEPTDRRKLIPGRSTKGLYQRNPRFIKTLLTRMHVVDELCMPYEVYFKAAIEHYMQTRGYGTHIREAAKGALDGYDLPPISMLGTGDAIIKAQLQYERVNKIRMYLPTHSHYLSENWYGSANQQDCARFLIQQARMRQGETMRVLAVMAYDRKILREHEVVRHMGLETVKQMRSIYAQM